MTYEITKPTKITKEQYKKGFFAIDRQNADHWFVNHHDDIRLWVGQYHESLINTNHDMLSGEMQSAEINGIIVIDENGQEKEIEAITFDTKDSYNDLDLELLEEGKISWY